MKTDCLQVGQCPKCGGYNLNYGVSEPVDEQYKYPFDCPDCGFSGIEWYSLTFTAMTTDTGEEIEIDHTN